MDEINPPPVEADVPAEAAVEVLVAPEAPVAPVEAVHTYNVQNGGVATDSFTTQ